MTTTEATPAAPTAAAAAREAILEAIQEALNELDNLPDAEFRLDLEGDGDDEGTIRIDHNGREIDDAVIDTRRAIVRAQEVATEKLDGLAASAKRAALAAAYEAGWNQACRAMDDARLAIQHYHAGLKDSWSDIRGRDAHRDEWLRQASDLLSE